MRRPRLPRRVLPGLLALALLGACESGGRPARTPVPGSLAPAVPLPADPAGAAAGLVDFGRVELGRSATTSVYLANPGETALVVERPEASGPFFADVPLAGLRLGPGEQVALPLGFVPAAVGPADALLVVRAGEASLTLRLRGEGVPGPPCRLAVTNQVGFGVVEPYRTVAEPVEVRAAEGRCRLDGAEVEGVGFGIVPGPLAGVTLLPGGPALPVEVSFRPLDSGPYQGRLRLLAGTAAADVLLAGTGGPLPRCLRWEGGMEPFVAIQHPRCGNAVTWAWAPYNATDRTLELADVELVAGAGEGLALAAWSPLSIGSGASLSIVPVDASGVGPSGVDGTVRYLFAGCQPFDLPVQVAGFADARSISHYQTSRAVLDLLIVVEDTPAMAPYDGALAELAHAIALATAGSSLDLHLGVTTTSTVDGEGCPAADGRLLPIDGSQPRVFTAATDGLEGHLARRLAGSRCAAAGTGRGLEAAIRALTPPLVDSADDPRHAEPNDGNAGFRRPGAPLRILFVSSGEDASAGTAEEAFGALAAIDGFRRAFALVGPAGGCPGAVDGARYRHVVERSDGWTGSICDEWTVPTGALLGVPPAASSFALNYPAADLDGDGRIVGETDGLAVRVSSSPVDEFDGSGFRNWSYEPAGPAISFQPAAVPPSGTRVDIQYLAECPSGP